MKRYVSITLLVALAMSAAPVARVHAQSQGVQKAFESVKESLDSLVTAKDDRQPMELSLRIETLRKVLDLSLAEAKDTRVKLLELENLKGNEAVWRDISADTMKDALDYFQSQKQYLDDNEKTLAIDEVKGVAKDFKDWRDKNYLPTFSAVRDYFLVNQQDKTIETARKRWQKIDADVQKLEKAKVKGIKDARAMLVSADKLIAESATFNKDARALFFSAFINTIVKTASTTATSTDNTASSTATELIFAASSTDSRATSTESSASSTDEKATSTVSAAVSVRDTVKQSLSRIRDAYNVYIDMSALVRKLLK